MGSGWPFPVPLPGRTRRRSVCLGKPPTSPSPLADSCSTTGVRHRTARGTAFCGEICSRIRPGRTATVRSCDGGIRHTIAPDTDLSPVTRAPAGASRDSERPASRQALSRAAQHRGACARKRFRPTQRRFQCPSKQPHDKTPGKLDKLPGGLYMVGDTGLEPVTSCF